MKTIVTSRDWNNRRLKAYRYVCNVAEDADKTVGDHLTAATHFPIVQLIIAVQEHHERTTGKKAYFQIDL